MFTLICRHHDGYVHKTQSYMLKVTVTFRGQRSKLYSLYRVLARPSQIIVVSSLYYVEMFTPTCKQFIMIDRYVYKPHDPMSKVKVMLRGQMPKFAFYTLSGP